MAKQSKIVLASLSLDTVAQAGKDTAKAIVACEAAKAKLLSELVGVANRLAIPLSAVQYDRQFAPAYRDALALSVKRGKLSETTAKQYGSKVKTALLAMLSGFRPVAGETFWAFYDRAAEAMSGLKLPDGSPVWSSVGKAGRKPGATINTKAKGLPAMSAGDASEQEGGDNRPAILRAALIVAGSDARAERLVIVMQSYADEFDKWTSTILADASKRKAA